MYALVIPRKGNCLRGTREKGYLVSEVFSMETHIDCQLGRKGPHAHKNAKPIQIVPPRLHDLVFDHVIDQGNSFRQATGFFATAEDESMVFVSITEHRQIPCEVYKVPNPIRPNKEYCLRQPLLFLMQYKTEDKMKESIRLSFDGSYELRRGHYIQIEGEFTV
jgi:hypothetical protein